MVKLGKVTVIYTGTGFPKELQGCKEGKYPFYKVGDISKNVLAGYKKLMLCDNYIEEDAVKKIKGKILPKDTVVFAKIGEAVKLNRRAITTKECLVDNNVMGIAPVKSFMDINYLYYYMSFVKLENLAEATTVPSVKKGMIEDLEIDLPTLDTQRIISNIISEVDDLILLINKQLDDLNVIVKSRFIEMFGLLLTQEKAVTLENLISQNIITYHLDGNHGGLYPKADEFVRTGVPYLGANAIIDGRIDFKKAKFLTERKASILRKGIAQNGDVLFAHNATVGPVAILKTDYKKVIVSTSLTVYRCNNRRILPVFIKYFMESEFFVNQYKKDMKQTTRNQVPITHQKKFMFIVPPIELQNQFADFVAQVDKSKLAIQQSLDELETLKKSLMQQYFG